MTTLSCYRSVSQLIMRIKNQTIASTARPKGQSWQIIIKTQNNKKLKKDQLKYATIKC